MHITTISSKEFLLFVQVLAVRSDHTLRVEHQDILLLSADSHIEFGTRDGSSTRAVDHDLHLFNILTNHFKGIFQSGSRNDSRTMLVVVHHGDVESTLQALLDIEALRRLDILKVDTAEGRRNLLYRFTEFLRVLLSHLDIEHIDATIDFKQEALTLHDGFAAHGANITQSKNSRSVRDYSHEVSFVSISIGSLRVLLDLKTRIGNTRRVGERQVCLCTVSLGRLHFNFSRTASLMIVEGGLFRDFYHNNISSFTFVPLKTAQNYKK